MRGVLMYGAALLSVLYAAPVLSAQSGGASETRVIVLVRPESSGPRPVGVPPVAAQRLEAVTARLAARGLRGGVAHQHLGIVTGVVTSAERASLVQDPDVLLVENDEFVSIPTEIPWGVAKVRAPEAWGTSGPRGRGVKVAIMDSGGDIDHPDLVWSGGYDAVTGSTASSAWDDNISVCNGHGTHVAGTVGARANGIGVVGVAPEVSLYAIKVFEVINNGCSAWTSKQIAGLNWAVGQGVRVVNISIGGSSYNSSYAYAIDQAAAAGTIVVASAGNNGSTVLYPAAYPSSIAVAATDQNNARPSWSSVGASVWVAAPGVGISSTMPGGGYGSKSGTSMAAPHVTGAVALLLEVAPNLTAAQVRDRLAATARDIQAVGRDNQSGYGLIEADALVQGITAPPPPPPEPLVLSVIPASRRVTSVVGTTSQETAAVSLTGTGASTTTWSATTTAAWLTITAGSGTGNGEVRYTRQPGTRTAGTYVGEVRVTAAGQTRLLVDTLILTAPPTVEPITVAFSGTGGRRAMSPSKRGRATTFSLAVTATGTGSDTVSWLPSVRPGVQLSTTQGVTRGSANVSLSSRGDLPVGRYIDTVVVTPRMAGIAVARYVDTLEIVESTKRGKPSGGRGNATPLASMQVLVDTIWAPATSTVIFQGPVAGVIEVEDGERQGTIPILAPGLVEGVHMVSAQVTHADDREETHELSAVQVNVPPTLPTSLAAYAGIVNLSPTTVLWLDRLGNRNGEFDLADLVGFAAFRPTP